jgi:hypothetical protein
MMHIKRHVGTRGATVGTLTSVTFVDGFSRVVSHSGLLPSMPKEVSAGDITTLSHLSGSQMAFSTATALERRIPNNIKITRPE